MEEVSHVLFACLLACWLAGRMHRQPKPITSVPLMIYKATKLSKIMNVRSTMTAMIDRPYSKQNKKETPRN
jgi:hypothetical protein